MVPQPGKVLKDKLQVQAGPGQDFAVVTTLSKGDIVQVLSQASPEGWIKVAGPSSETGFVPSESVEQKATPLPTGTLTPVPVQPAMATTAALTSTDAGQPSAPATPEVMQVSVTPKAVQPAEAMVTENGIKLREGPGTSFGIVVKLKANDPITVTGVNEDDQWFLVRLSDNTEGWLAVRYVQLKPTPTVTSSPPTATVTVLPTATVVLAMLPVTSTIPLLTPEITPSPPTSLTLASFPPAEGAETTVQPLPTVSPAIVQGLAGAILILLGVGALGVAIVFGAMSIWARRG
jgi:uncharacterized protein YgiM (DUF1202 family)